MSLGTEQSESSSRKRPYSDPTEVKVEAGSVTTTSGQIGLLQCLGISPLIETKKPQEFLPDLDDPDAIDAFFRRSRRQRSPAHETIYPWFIYLSEHWQCASSFRASEGTLPNNHPMKEFVEQPENREMSVKEALARGFRNYRVRLPKIRRVLAPAEFQPGTFIPDGSFSNTAVHGNSFEASNSVVDKPIPSTSHAPFDLPLEDSLLLTEPTPTNLNEMLASTYTLGHIMEFEKNMEKSINDIQNKEQNNTLINNNQFSVSFNEPITFEINEKTIILTLKELFAANGIIILNEKNVEQLQEVFNSSFLLINNCIAQFLLNSQRTGSDESVTLTRSRNRRKISMDNPIVLSETIPPFACYQLPLFLTSLGTQFGENEILDKSHFPTNTDFPAASRSESPKHPSYPSEPYEQEPSTSTAVITKEEPENIIQQAATPMFIEESREEVIVRKITQNMDNIDEQSPIRIMESPPKELRTIKKNRVRRTSFVGLNVLMWRFFRECADNNIPLNGKQLKEHAMIIARKLGLDQFKGSEGWLDAFKRRHKIDLKQMTGSPANYEDEGIEETTDVRMEQEGIANEEATNGSVTAALLNTVEKAYQPTALASISNTIPLDLQYLLGETAEADLISGLMSSTTSSPYMSTGVAGFANANLRDNSSESNQIAKNVSKTVATTESKCYSK